MCIVSSGETTWGTKEDEKEKIEDIKLESDSEKKYDLSYKVVFLGDKQVGKTQILNKHINIRFNDKSDPTIGSGELMSKNYNCTTNEGNKIIRLQICDTPGDETYRSLVPINIKTAEAIVLVYDITQKESFDNIKNNWLGLATKYNIGCKNYFLVGNKADLKNNNGVPANEAKGFAKENNMQFLEVSAKNSDKIEELFEDIVNRCLIKDKDAIQNNKCCICCRCCPCNKENKRI